MKKILRLGSLLLLLAVILTSILVGCGSTNNGSDKAAASSSAASSSATNTAASDEKVTLTIEGSQAQKTNSPEMFSQANIDAFQKKYPNINVQLLLIPDAQATSTLQTKLVAGEPSDIIVYNKVSAENELDAQKNMIDLSNEEWVSRLNDPNSFKAPDGKIYGFTLASNIGAQAMVYNKDIFDELHLSVPKTYDELLQVCAAIKAKGITPIYAPFKDVWTFQVWTTTQFGVIAAKEKPGIWDQINSGKLKWSDVPEFKDVLQKGLELYQKGYMQKSALSDDYNGAPAAFQSKKYAMMIMGDWFITDMQTKDPGLKLDLFPLPALKGQDQDIGQAQIGGMAFIPSKAKHIDAAKQYIDFLSQKEQVDKAQETKPFLPNIKDVSAPKLTPLQQSIVDKYIKTKKADIEMNAYMKVDLNDLWKYYQDMFAGGKSPEQVMAAWDKKFAELMKAKGQPGF